VVNCFVLGGKVWEILFGKNISFSNKKANVDSTKHTRKIKKKMCGSDSFGQLKKKEEGDFSFHLKSWSSLSH